MTLVALLTLVALTTVESSPSNGQRIGAGDFSPAVRVQDFNGLPLFVENNAAPLVIDGDTYFTDFYALITYNPIFGGFVGRSGEAIGTSLDTEPLNVILGSPAHRVGAYIGTSSPWTAHVEFFDAQGTFVGSFDESGLGSEGKFVGWQIGDGRIAHLRVTDTAENGRILIMDDLMTELVPEPTTAALLAWGVLACRGPARRKPGQRSSPLDSTNQ